MSDQIKGDWYVTCSDDIFNKLKIDAQFLQILRLSRIVNSLRFCQMSEIKIDDPNTSPWIARQQINSFFFACAVLYEGLNVADTLGKHFKDIESFQKGFSYLMKDKDIKELREKVLYRMRNTFVFHFDGDVAPQTLQEYEQSSHIFMKADSLNRGDVYYTLADEVVINYLLSDEKNDEEKKKRYKKIVTITSEAVSRFINAAEELIYEVLCQMGWTIKDSQTKPNAG